MESLLPILIGVAFIILQAVNANKKKKEAAQRKVVMPQHPQATTPPPAASNPFDEWIKTLRQDLVIDQEEEEEEEVQPKTEEKLYPIHSAAPADKPMDSVAEMATVQEISDEEKAAFAEDTGKKTSPILKEFDIRKAVVYSEILRPKFE